MLVKGYSHVNYSLEIFSKNFHSFVLKTHAMMSKGDACVKFNNGISNGVAWYVIDGEIEDWSYTYTSNMQVTIELGCNRHPDQNDLKSYLDDNKGVVLACKGCFISDGSIFIIFLSLPYLKMNRH